MPLHMISPAHLMRRIGLPDAPRLLDVRLPEDRADIPFDLPTGMAVSHRDTDALRQQAGAGPVVVLCHKGLKLSIGAAAVLRSMGCAAEVLDGGIVAWQEAGLPLVPHAARPDRAGLWVTRARPKVDRIACPWLIRRFIDPEARFIFVPTRSVLDVADRFNGISYDVENADFTHDADRCTFDALLQAFGLSTPPLDRLAEVIRAADTGRVSEVPQAAGLLAASVGFSRMYRSDDAQLEAALPLYDALYRWARDGQGEAHVWPHEGGPT